MNLGASSESISFTNTPRTSDAFKKSEAIYLVSKSVKCSGFNLEICRYFVIDMGRIVENASKNAVILVNGHGSGKSSFS